MIFNSIDYAVFLPVVVLVFWRLRSHRARLVLIVAASYYFYGSWDVRFLGLIIVSTVVDYQVGRSLAASNGEARRRWLLVTSVVVNLGILATFKYFNFFRDSAGDVLSFFGNEPDLPSLDVVLPVGISFYTFQTMSYTIDVFRRQLEPTKDLLQFAAYVAFFPQLVAGPIERARDLLPQLAARTNPPNVPEVASALLLIARGLVMKVVVADRVAPVANEAFAGASDAGWITLAIGVVAFGLQIYGDFAGYSDIARGSARLLGVELKVNFRQPYLSASITEFWRRWHISLSDWLRDYLYVPLGGNRRGQRRTHINLMLTMVIGGLWHGASWNFVVWGAIHGFALTIHRVFGRRRAHGAARPSWADLPAVLMTFAATNVAWIFFRAQDFGEAWSILGGIASWRAGGWDGGDAATVAIALVGVVAIDVVSRRSTAQSRERLIGKPETVGVLLGLSLAGVVLMSGASPVPFIYFQF